MVLEATSSWADNSTRSFQRSGQVSTTKLYRPARSLLSGLRPNMTRQQLFRLSACSYSILGQVMALSTLSGSSAKMQFGWQMGA
jgi:hypothetical protein